MPTERFGRLLEPGRIGTLELKNRIAMPAMGNRLSGVWGEVTDDLIEYYAARARGGTGLIFTEAAHMATAMDGLRLMNVQLRADDDAFLPGLGKLVEAIHNAGAKMGIQLTPGGGAQTHGHSWTLGLQHYAEESPPLAPSPVPSPVVKLVPRELTLNEIAKLVELCGWAAGRVKRAGFDIIELHAHGGYLIGEFISPYFNKRTDRYGGSLDNRLRFLFEIIEAMRKHVGPYFPFIVKYSVDEYFQGGLELKDGLSIARRLEQAGVNGINASCGIYGAKQPITAPCYYPEGYLVPLAQAVKEVVRIPVIVTGRLGNPDLAEQVLREGKADFIGMGRPVIADPDLPRKVAEGRTGEIRRCIACNACRDIVTRDAVQIRCAVNATAGREHRYGTLKRAEKAKRVVVVGAGPAGMEAARVAALRGHSVTLYEKSGELGGGELRLASIAPHKEVLNYIVDYYSTMFKQLDNVELRLGKEATAGDIVKENPDAVIVATGGSPLVPDIPGVDKKNVTTAFDVLAGKVNVGKNVVVVGGGSVGCETANWLARQGKKVTIVEMLDAVGADIEAWTWRALQAELSQAGVTIMTHTRLDAVIDEGAVVSDKAGQKSLLKADTIVLAVGVKPVNSLAKELSGKVRELHLAGDAREVKRLRHAVSDGFIVAYNL